MGKVILDISVSLDGYAAGPDVCDRQPMGRGGEALHHWLFEGKTEADEKIIAATFKNSGAVMVGGNTYHTAIHGVWGGTSPFPMHAFVITSTVPPEPVAGFTYVTNGFEEALSLARVRAGEDNVWIMGGVELAKSALKSGLLDEIHIHIVPILLGDGLRLFNDVENPPIHLEIKQVVSSPAVTHLQMRMIK
jgi:dihydrofolate reductase